MPMARSIVPEWTSGNQQSADHAEEELRRVAGVRRVERQLVAQGRQRFLGGLDVRRDVLQRAPAGRAPPTR